jgi:hypothetical protein
VFRCPFSKLLSHFCRIWVPGNVGGVGDDPNGDGDDVGSHDGYGNGDGDVFSDGSAHGSNRDNGDGANVTSCSGDISISISILNSIDIIGSSFDVDSHSVVDQMTSASVTVRVTNVHICHDLLCVPSHFYNPQALPADSIVAAVVDAASMDVFLKCSVQAPRYEV